MLEIDPDLPALTFIDAAAAAAAADVAVVVVVVVPADDGPTSGFLLGSLFFCFSQSRPWTVATTLQMKRSTIITIIAIAPGSNMPLSSGNARMLVTFVICDNPQTFFRTVTF